VGHNGGGAAYPCPCRKSGDLELSTAREQQQQPAI